MCYTYNIEYLDKENGEIYLRARYYSSEHGRFVTEDPSRYGANWYSYFDNNPVTKVDRMGLRPTTDGSANADKYANDYMKETYPKQNQSVSKAPTTPPPQTSEPSKPSKPSKPSYVKYYNPDHNEFESPTIISIGIGILENYVFNEVSTSVGKAAGELARQSTIYSNPIKGFELVPVSVSFPRFATNADEVVKYVAKVTSGVTKVAGFVTGGILDYYSQILSGENEKDAFNKTLLHMGVTLVVSALGITGVGAIIAITLGTLVVDKVYDGYRTRDTFSKSYKFA